MKQDKLIQTRKLKGYSQKELASLVHMEQTTYSRKERGIHIFSEKEWEKIADILETKVDEIQTQEKSVQYNENCTFSEHSIGCVGVQYANVPKEMLDTMQKYIKLLERENERLRNQRS